MNAGFTSLSLSLSASVSHCAGTVRSNLDPFDVASDADIWDVLRQIQLHELVTGFEQKLLHPVQECMRLSLSPFIVLSPLSGVHFDSSY
jgi:ABC-type multidrug transport system fused ATPase/permease subunit